MTNRRRQIEYINKIDLSEKLFQKSSNRIVSIKEGVLSCSSTNTHLLDSILFLELLSIQKGLLVRSKKNIMQFSIRKRLFNSVNVILRRDALYNFNYMLNIINLNSYRSILRTVGPNYVHLSISDLSSLDITNAERNNLLNHARGLNVIYKISEQSSSVHSRVAVSLTGFIN